MSNTVLIADDNPTVRRSIRCLIEGNTDWTICGEAEDGGRAVERVQSLHPDIVILDLAMPVMNGLEAARQINKIASGSLMVMYTMYANSQLTKEAQAAGIRQVVTKGGNGGRELISAIRELLPTQKRRATKRRDRVSPLV
jgi:DNA-binding NarL/FixJ family response regulator